MKKLAFVLVCVLCTAFSVGAIGQINFSNTNNDVISAQAAEVFVESEVKNAGDNEVIVDPDEYERIGFFKKRTNEDGSSFDSLYARESLKVKMRKAYMDMMTNGFNMGLLSMEERDGEVRIMNDCAVQIFDNGDSTGWGGPVISSANSSNGTYIISESGAVSGNGSPQAYLVVGSPNIYVEASALVNEFLSYWIHYNETTGYPIGNRFQDDDGNWIQNFQRGYLKFYPSRASASIVRLATTGATTFYEGELSAVPSNITIGLVDFFPRVNISLKSYSVGEFGEDVAYWVGDADHKSEISAKFVAKYNAIKGDSDTSPMGSPVTPVELFADGVMGQIYEGGYNLGSGGYPGKTAYLLMNQANGKVFTLRDNVMVYWKKYESITDTGIVNFSKMGYPLSDEFTFDGQTHQVFSKGYIRMDGAGFGAKIGAYPGQLDNGIISDEEQTAVYNTVSSEIFRAYKDYNNTVGNFGLAQSKVMRFKNTDLYYQRYTGGDNGTKSGYIAIRTSLGFAYAIKGKAAEIFESTNLSEIGSPISPEFTVSGTTYQNFSGGYVNLTSGKFEKGKRIIFNKTSEANVGTVTLGENVGAGSVSGFGSADSVRDAFVSKAEALMKSSMILTDAIHNIRVENNFAVQRIKMHTSTDSEVLLVKETEYSPVFALYGPSLEVYNSVGAAVTGAPVSDRFNWGYKSYQNFKNGYVVIDETNYCQYIEGVNFNLTSKVFIDTETGYEADIFTPKDSNTLEVGEFGSPSSIPISLRRVQDKIKASFQAEYMRLMILGINPGIVDDEGVHKWAPGTFEWINQSFRNGDNSATLWGNYNSMRIFMIDPEKPAIGIYGGMMQAWADKGNIGEVGYPIEQGFYLGDDYVQNFNNGYIICYGGESAGAQFFDSKWITETGEVADDIGGDVTNDEGFNIAVVIIPIVGVLIMALLVVGAIMLDKYVPFKSLIGAGSKSNGATVNSDGADESNQKKENNDDDSSNKEDI